MSFDPRWLDRWLADVPEDTDGPECVKCGDLMEWQADHDEFGPCGDWKCVSKDCAPHLYQNENEQETKQKNGSDCESSQPDSGKH